MSTVLIVSAVVLTVYRRRGEPAFQACTNKTASARLIEALS